MMNAKKNLIIEIITSLVIIGLIVGMFFVDLNLGIFKVVSIDTLMSQFNYIKELDTKLLTAKTNYDDSIKIVETAKSDYIKQKEQYDAITDETIAIIKEATTDEKYNIEYMWIKLGNYAKSNNLTLSLVEPGGAGQASSTTPKTTAPKTTTPTTTTPTTTTPTTTTPTTTTPTTTTPTTTTPTTTTPTTTTPTTTTPTTTTPTAPIASTSKSEFTIKVQGNYIDVSDFIFELENDAELRFKLDKINMEYAGSNEITATFVVKNLKFVK
ncbi:MAG: hypothetical protein PHD15_00750 [Clostridia bacterium]|nr:hypothetical protein [Clostridia bacterium]MDD4386279.1 hypothetical protein [Clostridia bacterium]